jgi:hypothetical protein
MSSSLKQKMKLVELSRENRQVRVRVKEIVVGIEVIS